MSLHAKVSGSWKEIGAVHTRVSGEWKECESVHVKVGETWREVFSCYNGADSYTVLLLHGERTDGVTAFADSSYYGHAVTVGNHTQVDTAQKAIGDASILFDGNDHLALADHAAWYFGTGDFTIDLWFRLASLPTAGNYMNFMQQREDVNNRWGFWLYNKSGTYKIQFYNTDGGSDTIVVSADATISQDTWYHLALVRSGNDFKIFLNGTQIGSTVTDSSEVTDHAGALYVGQNGASGSYLNGWLDEIRVSKGIARWTGTFTPPSTPYGGWKGNDLYTKLLLHGNGADASTALADSSWYNTKTITVAGGAQVDTAQSKFGGGSILFDGSGDYITCMDSGDYAFGSGDFTIDLWVRVSSLPGAYDAIFSDRQGSGSFYYGHVLWITDANKLHYSWYDTDHSAHSVTADNAMAANTWYHVAVVRSGGTLTMYINGVAQATTASVTGKTMYDTGVVLYFGTDGAYGTYDFAGWLEEVRISKGIARWTANFTPPTVPYS